jgi:mannose/fructose/N-acetylgalactosamine-specific phosphotransferase system component IIC
MVFAEFHWQWMVLLTLGFVLISLWYVPPLIAFANGHRRRWVILGVAVFGLAIAFVSPSVQLSQLGQMALVVLWILLLVWAQRSRRPKS